MLKKIGTKLNKNNEYRGLNIKHCLWHVTHCWV